MKTTCKLPSSPPLSPMLSVTTDSLCHKICVFQVTEYYFGFFLLINMEYNVQLLKASLDLKLDLLCMAFLSHNAQHKEHLTFLHEKYHSGYPLTWLRTRCNSSCTCYREMGRSRSAHCPGSVQIQHPGWHILENQDYARCQSVTY